MSRKSEITQRQRERIQQLSKENLSSNKIQEQLQNEGLGLRRKTLLAEVRRAKGELPKPSAERIKYVPRKYREHVKYVSWEFQKTVTIRGLQRRKFVEKQRRDTGSNLYRWVKQEMTSREWDGRPEVIS